MYEKYVRDPVYGYVSVTGAEKNIIDTFPVQRLRGIKQLSVSNIAYPGGDHSRFLHSLGTMHLAGKMAESLGHEEKSSDDKWQLVRLAGLLHDVGHGPFSHSSEEIVSKYCGFNHEDLGKRVIEESSLAKVIEEQGFKPAEIIELAFADSSDDRYMHQIIASQLDVDKMDFLLRDSYFTGVEYGQIDVQRLIQAMEVFEGDVAVDKKALSALETFMIARYEMFLNVYYHHSVRAAEIMLRNAMDHVHDVLGLTTFDGIEDFLKLDDAHVVSGLRNLSPSDYEGSRREDVKSSKEIFERLQRRELIKPCYEREVHLEDEYVAKLLGDDTVRHQKEKEIAEMAGVDSEYVTVDVPTLASMPYYPGEIEPKEVPVFESSVDGKKKSVPLSEVSRLVNVLKGYIDIVRVYTFPEHRKKVGKAAEEVFRQLPLSAQISM